MFATSWLEDQQTAYEQPLRFLLGLLETFKQHIQLGQTMLQDIDADFPTLRNLLGSRGNSSGTQPGSLQLTNSEPIFDLSRLDTPLGFSRASEYGVLFGETNVWNTDEDFLYGNFLP